MGTLQIDPARMTAQVVQGIDKTIEWKRRSRNPAAYGQPERSLARQ
jgi:hypothetical protein